jgi:biotin carboxyl carrier protein
LVKLVRVAPGETVEKGQVLVEFEGEAVSSEQ